MNENEVVRILDKSRHDALNHIQLIQGYLAMNRPEQVKEKLADWVERYEQERRLSSMRIPKFTIWTVRFDMLYSRLRLSYKINTSANLADHDEEMYRLSKQFADTLLECGSPEILHEVTLFAENDNKNIYFEFRAEGPFEHAARFGSGPATEFQTEYKADEKEIRYRIMIPYQS